jgi:hypothetical protein
MKKSHLTSNHIRLSLKIHVHTTIVYEFVHNHDTLTVLPVEQSIYSCNRDIKSDHKRYILVNKMDIAVPHTNIHVVFHLRGLELIHKTLHYQYTICNIQSSCS